jgi:dihydroorotate dehydrogenase (fumarate)
MIDLSTKYLGLTLKNPIVPSSSPLSRDLDQAKQLHDAGASAIVMHSLFEEETLQEEEHYARFLEYQSLGHAEATGFHPAPEQFTSKLDQYLEQLQKLKNALDIPVIASLNGISLEGWIDHAKELQQAGADALELNVYYVAANINETGEEVEQRYLELLSEVKKQVTLPVTMKLSSQFSAVANFVKKLENAGADGISIFNRFYQPDIDLETLDMTHSLEYSSSSESLLRIRWAGILRGEVDLSIAITGGIHTPQDVIKALLVGADATHMCSALLINGPEHIQNTLKVIYEWMQEKEYESVQQLKGSFSRACAANPADYERANYVKLLDSYRSGSGVRK